MPNDQWPRASCACRRTVRSLCPGYQQYGRRNLAYALLSLAVASLPIHSHAQKTQKYTVLIQKEVAGALVTSTDAQGKVSVDFSYRNNGRGPDLKEEFSVDTFGAPVFYVGSGKSTYGNEIKESYAWQEGRGRWSSPVDNDDKPVEAGALYVPVEGSSLLGAQLARSLLLRPGKAAPGVAGGKFSVERVADLKLGTPTGEVPVALYALNGIDVAPWYYWLRDDAEKTFFADVSPWLEIVPEGYEAHGAALLARQQQARTDRLQQLQQRLARPLTGLTVIRNVRWFDSRVALMRGPSDIFVYEGLVSAIEPAGTKSLEPAHIIDGSGKTLLPGLYDMHAHMDRESGLFHLAAGVTSVRDPGSFNDQMEDLRGKIDAGILPGPRVQPMGFIEGRSDFSARMGFVVDSLEAAKEAVDWYAQRGFIQIKLYNSFKPDWAKPLADYAHAKGLRVGGHVPAFMRAEEAVLAGYDEIHHINQVMLNFLVTDKDDTRTLLRFSLVGDKARDLDLDGPQAQGFLRLLRERETVVDVTLTVFEPAYLQRDGQANPSFGMIADHMPLVVQRWFRSASSEINDENAPRYMESFAKMLAYVGRLYAAGVPLVAGTDTYPGFGLHRELELYVLSGIPPLRVLQIATWNGAKYTQTLDQRGSIERGKLADLMLVDGDPSTNISDIRRVSLVLKGGTAYSPAQIYEALGVRPFSSAATVTARTPQRP
jgi:Amidohydrolase family